MEDLGEVPSLEEIVDAAARGNVWDLRDLLSCQEGEDPHPIDSPAPPNNETALLAAALGGHLPACQMLINEAGASTKVASRGGWTALHGAAYGGHVHVMALLVRKGADIEARDLSGWTPLFAAASRGQLGAVEWLIEVALCDAGSTDDDGCTCLFPAVDEGHLHIVRYLVETHAVNMHHVALDGHRAAFWGCRKGHLPIINYLQQAASSSGAQPAPLPDVTDISVTKKEYDRSVGVPRAGKGSVSASSPRSPRSPRRLPSLRVDTTWDQDRDRADLTRALASPVKAEQAYGVAAFDAEQALRSYRTQRNLRRGPEAAKIQARVRGNMARRQEVRIKMLEAENDALKRRVADLMAQLAQDLPSDVVGLQKMLRDSEQRIVQAMTEKTMAQAELAQYQKYMRFNMARTAKTASKIVRMKQKARKKMLRKARRAVDGDETVQLEAQRDARMLKQKEARAEKTAQMAEELAKASVRDATNLAATL